MSTIPTGRFVWFEYFAPDLKKAQGFFGELFNWSTVDVPMPQGSYTMISAGSETIGGYQPLPPGAPKHGHWLPHLQVESAAASATKIKEAGGKVRMEPMKLGDVGTMAVVADPLDGTFCLWQPVKAQGDGNWKHHAGAFCWVQLQTADVDKSLAFYQRIGGFGATENAHTPGYKVLTSDGEMRGGIMKPATPMPQAWTPYVQIANADATVEKAKKLGATIVLPQTDVPTVGRIAVFADPQGGVIGILQPA